MKLKIANNYHAGEKGHRSYTAIMVTIDSVYWRTDIRQDIKKLIQSCIHCIVFRIEEIIPRLLSTALHEEKLNEVVHADLIYMGPAEESNVKYMLIIKDGISSYTGLCPCDNVDSDAASAAVAKWVTCFGLMDWLLTNQYLLFKVSLIEK